MHKKHQIKSVLIIRITATGDILMASPVATAIKRQNPETRIAWLVHPEYETLLAGHPAIDTIIAFDLDRWQALWRKNHLSELYKMANALRKEFKLHKFDRTVDLQGTLTTGIVAKLSGAKQRIALGSEGGNAWFMTKTISRNLGDQTQMGAEYRYLVNQLGGTDTNWTMFVPDTRPATRSARQRLNRAFGNQPYAVACPFARQPQKNWFEDYWTQIILRIRGRYQLRTVIVGGANGKEAGDRIAQFSGALNLSGRTGLAETAAIIKGASLLIGVDTGLTHMGHAVKIPTISLFGATYPYAYVDSEVSKVIYLDRFCSPCRHHPTCGKKYQCMRDITPDKVLTAIKPLMKKADVSTPRSENSLSENE